MDKITRPGRLRSPRRGRPSLAPVAPCAAPIGLAHAFRPGEARVYRMSFRQAVEVTIGPARMGA